MVSTNEILSKLKSILNERFGIDATAFDESTKLGEIGIDSLHVVDIMLDIESELNFNFADLTLPANPSLGDITASISKNIK